VSGLVFGEVAWAWDPGQDPPQTVGTGGIDALGPASVQGRLGSLGTGFFIGGGYFPAIRWTYAWPTIDFRTYARRPRTQFSIGFNF